MFSNLISKNDDKETFLPILIKRYLLMDVDKLVSEFPDCILANAFGFFGSSHRLFQGPLKPTGQCCPTDSAFICRFQIVDYPLKNCVQLQDYDVYEAVHTRGSALYISALVKLRSWM